MSTYIAYGLYEHGLQPTLNFLSQGKVVTSSLKEIAVNEFRKESNYNRHYAAIIIQTATSFDVFSKQELQ